jgi:Family of unknown function (DUF5691)
MSDTTLDVTAMLSELTSVALLGTERRTFQPPRRPADGATLDPLLHGICSVADVAQTPEELIALTATLLDLYRRMGVAPAVGAPDSRETPEQPEPPSAPPPSAAATQLLDLLLSGTVAVARKNDALLAQWFEGCARSGQRIEYRQLVDALNRANGVPELRPAIVGALGERGMLLARANKTWSWALRTGQQEDARTNEEPIDADTFAKTDASARPMLLTSWRKRDPEQTVAVLGQSWTNENATDRAAFVSALVTGLQNSDQQFLESALDDKAKSVRFAAAKLLALLPNTAWLTRMQERVDLVVGTRGTLRKKIEFVLPEESIMDAAWVRDGLDAFPKGKNAPQAMGPKAWALIDLTRLAPLHCWELATQRTPGELVKAAVESEVRKELFVGWGNQTQEHRNEPWALAMINQPDFGYLLSALGSEAGNAFVANIVKTTKQPYDIVTAMSQLHGPPTEELLGAIVTRLEREVPGWLPVEHYIVNLFEDASPALLKRIAKQAPEAEKHIRQLQAAQSLRQAITQEFS